MADGPVAIQKPLFVDRRRRHAEPARVRQFGPREAGVAPVEGPPVSATVRLQMPRPVRAPATEPVRLRQFGPREAGVPPAEGVPLSSTTRLQVPRPVTAPDTRPVRVRQVGPREAGQGPAGEPQVRRPDLLVVRQPPVESRVPPPRLLGRERVAEPPPPAPGERRGLLRPIAPPPRPQREPAVPTILPGVTLVEDPPTAPLGGLPRRLQVVREPLHRLRVVRLARRFLGIPPGPQPQIIAADRGTVTAQGRPANVAAELRLQATRGTLTLLGRAATVIAPTLVRALRGMVAVVGRSTRVLPLLATGFRPWLRRRRRS